MKTLYDVISKEARESVALLLGFKPGPGMDSIMRNIPAPGEGFTVGDAMTAYMDYVTKQNARVVEIEVRNVYGNFTIYPINEAAKLFAEIAGTKTLTNKTLALAERMGFAIKEVFQARTRFGVKEAA